MKTHVNKSSFYTIRKNGKYSLRSYPECIRDFKKEEGWDILPQRHNG